MAIDKTLGRAHLSCAMDDTTFRLLKVHCVYFRLKIGTSVEEAVTQWLASEAMAGRVIPKSLSTPPEQSVRLNAVARVVGQSDPAAGSVKPGSPAPVPSVTRAPAGNVAALRTPPTLLDADTAMRDQDLDDHL